MEQMRQYVINHINSLDQGRLYAINLTNFRRQFMSHFSADFMTYKTVMESCLDVHAGDGGTYFCLKKK